MRPYATDDRGRDVPLVRIMLALVPWGMGPLPARVQYAVRGKLMAASMSARTLVRPEEWVYGGLIALLPSLATFGPWFFFQAVNWPPAWWRLAAVVVAMVPGLLLLPEMLWRLLPSRRADAVARLVVAQGWCGSCGFGLVDVPAQENGCKVCPECGAAWRMGAGESAAART